MSPTAADCWEARSTLLLAAAAIWSCRRRSGFEDWDQPLARPLSQPHRGAPLRHESGSEKTNCNSEKKDDGSDCDTNRALWKSWTIRNLEKETAGQIVTQIGLWKKLDNLQFEEKIRVRLWHKSGSGRKLDNLQFEEKRRSQIVTQIGLWKINCNLGKRDGFQLWPGAAGKVGGV